MSSGLARGWPVRYLPDAVVDHVGGASSVGDYRFGPWHAASMIRYLRDWHGATGVASGLAILWLRAVGQVLTLRSTAGRSLAALRAGLSVADDDAPDADRGHRPCPRWRGAAVRLPRRDPGADDAAHRDPSERGAVARCARPKLAAVAARTDDRVVVHENPVGDRASGLNVALAGLDPATEAVADGGRPVAAGA